MFSRPFRKMCADRMPLKAYIKVWLRRCQGKCRDMRRDNAAQSVEWGLTAHMSEKVRKGFTAPDFYSSILADGHYCCEP